MFDMMDAARLEGLHLAQDPATGLKAIIAIHSTRLGPALGGCRYLPYPNDEAAIGDAIRLAQGMSYKAALAGLEQGGGKAVIIRPPHLDNRGALFEAFGRFIESLGGRYITAVDSGTSSADMDCIAQQTRHVTSTTQAGDPSPHTALGVFAGIRASAQARLGSDDLEGLRVAVQGLGHVGYALAEQLAAVGAELLVGLYRQMLLTRLFDQKAVALQRTGRIGTYAPTLGQEAIGVAIGSQMRAEDVLVPYYRDTAVQLMRGVRMEDILLYWGGDERGSDYAEPLAAQDFPICVPIATQALHACGVASAFRIRGEHRVAVTTCGDGATSKGDFLEALNVAGAWQLPVLFVVNNNQWAISVPRRIQCGAPTLAEKAVGAGFPGEQVDGNDVLAVAERVRAALERARQGKGPTLLECISYRLCDHTTADDASRYRSAEEVNQAWREEPIKRLRAFLAGRGQWDEEREQALVGECQARVQEAVERFETFAAQAPQALFEHVYARWPAVLEEQREQLLERAARRRGGAEHE